MTKSKHNPIQQDHFPILLRCLAREVLSTRPSRQKRQEFYERWGNRHGDVSRAALVSAVNMEYQNFLGWCALHGIPESFATIQRYIRDTSPVSSPLSDAPKLDSDTGVSSSPAKVAPWWSELPHLAPFQGGAS